jgi:hypothetical protein
MVISRWFSFPQAAIGNQSAFLPVVLPLNSSPIKYGRLGELPAS